ncbi:MAG: J domain-containing protein [Croceibacterium sp.]
MGRLLVYAALAVIVWKMASGRWPWEPKVSTRAQAVFRARKLLGLRAGADRAEIIEAHRRLLTTVHPDRGGTSEQVYEAQAARDVLLNELPDA